jgi:hypothetical protein
MTPECAPAIPQTPHAVKNERFENLAATVEFIGSLFIFNYALLTMIILLTAFLDPTKSITIDLEKYGRGTVVIGIVLASLPLVLYTAGRYLRRLKSSFFSPPHW